MFSMKTFIISIISFFAILIAQYFYFKVKTNTLKEEIEKVQIENKKTVIKVRDSAFVEINYLVVESQKKIDSIVNLPPKIKWKKYEKPIYIDRTLDNALDVIEYYEYNK